MDSKDPILSLPEACKYIKASKHTLYRAINSGQVKAYKKGARFYFLESDLRKYLLSEPFKKADDK